MAGLLGRPMRPPTLAPYETCAASVTNDLGGVAPNYGAGTGPAYLSGQNSWYSGGQAAFLMVHSQYPGPLLVRPFQLLLVDEPFVGLDQPGKQTLLDLLDEAGDAGATVLVATHSLEFVDRADRCIALRDGEVDYDGPAAKWSTT